MARLPDKIISVQQQNYPIERRYNVVYEDSNGKQYQARFVLEAILNYHQKILKCFPSEEDAKGAAEYLDSIRIMDKL